MNIWITSDTHYSHTNIAGPKISRWKSGYRNFSSVKEMNSKIIENINKCVKEGDILWHLGDFSFGSEKNIKEFRQSIICKDIRLIYGNHDEEIENSKELQDLFTSVDYVRTEYIGRTMMHLSHYSHRVWPKSHRGSIHLYGHSHGSIPDFGKSMDVGIDCHPEFRPFHINEILEIMSKKEILKVDHHI